MRFPVSLIFAALLAGSVHAAGPVVSPVTTEVTVYRSGAKVSSQASVKVPAGATEVTFENLSPFVNTNSLQVKIKGSATLNSAVFQMNTPGPLPENPRIPVIRDSIVLLGDEMARFNNEAEVLNEKAELIRNNQSQIGNIDPNKNRTLTVAELRELTEYYSQEIGKVKNRHLEIAIALRALNKRLEKLNYEISRLQPINPDQTGEIVLKIESAAAQTLEITCTYLVNAASWTPLYDLRSTGINQNVQIVYKANVQNSTGFDWKNVKLHLSTAQPLANNNRPVLNPVFVDFRQVIAYRLQNDDNKPAPAPEANMYYLSERTLSADEARAIASQKEAGIQPELDIDLLVADAENANNAVVNFDIDNLQTILSNGQENTITIQESSVPAVYEYHVVPKLDPTVFLLAKIHDYGQYNLLPGAANIFFEDTYVGQTFLNTQTTSDTMLLSLGRDEQITVKRIQPKDFKDRKSMLSNKIRENYAFEITVKNNKSVPVTVTLLDQIPVSRQAGITVELLEKDGAKYAAEYGKLEWEINIPPAKNKKIRFEYSIEYPKDKSIGIFH